jgi:putative restriction endonuclease
VSVEFTNLIVGNEYSRNELADAWGYQSFHAIARGVVTPRYSNKIILFVTQEKQSSSEQYEDHIEGDRLYWEGPTDHFAEDRMVNSHHNGDEIHLFFRDRHHSDFVYYGRAVVESAERFLDRPSRFVMQLVDWARR